jgi:choline kinase
MKAIILAAGQGTRLRPLTNDRPKCMVEYNGKPIIDYIVETMYKENLMNVNIITGYLSDVLKNHLSKYERIMFYHNKDYATTNTVRTLWCANAEFDDDLIISYSDIIYSQNILKQLIGSSADISVVIDKNWHELWKQRMEDPLQDAESLILDDEDNILEIGQKVTSYDRIHGQYIGLIKISKQMLPKITHLYSGLSAKNASEKMCMTDFLQESINCGFTLKAVPIYGEWIEIDCVKDLGIYPIN